MDCEKCPIRDECEIIKELVPSIEACPLVQAMIDGIEKLFRCKVVRKMNEYYNAQTILNEYIKRRSEKKPEPPQILPKYDTEDTTTESNS